MLADGTRAQVRRRALAAVLVALSLGVAAAHATLVFGDVRLSPDPPRAGEPVTIGLTMEDPTEVPVADALVHVEATLEEAARDPAPAITSDALEEVSEGQYRTTITLPEPGSWRLLFRDRTFRQEEATASITVEVGEDAEAAGTVSFVFPPTATDQGLAIWLWWLIGLPLVAGVAVTVAVLRRPAGDDAATEADPDAPAR